MHLGTHARGERRAFVSAGEKDLDSQDGVGGIGTDEEIGAVAAVELERSLGILRMNSCALGTPMRKLPRSRIQDRPLGPCSVRRWKLASSSWSSPRIPPLIWARTVDVAPRLSEAKVMICRMRCVFFIG